jgi:hypothetical protein
MLSSQYALLFFHIERRDLPDAIDRLDVQYGAVSISPVVRVSEMIH